MMVMSQLCAFECQVFDHMETWTSLGTRLFVCVCMCTERMCTCKCTCILKREIWYWACVHVCVREVLACCYVVAKVYKGTVYVPPCRAHVCNKYWDINSYWPTPPLYMLYRSINPDGKAQGMSASTCILHTKQGIGQYLFVGSYLATKLYRQFAGYGKGLGHHQVGQWWTAVNYQQNSYLPIIGVHSTMHLVHPNYWQITIICSPWIQYFSPQNCMNVC